MKTQFVWLSDKGNNGGDVRTSSQEEEELEKISEINNFDRSRSEKVIIFGLIYFFSVVRYFAVSVAASEDFE